MSTPIMDLKFRHLQFLQIKIFDSGTILVEVSPGLEVGDPAQIQLSHKTNDIHIINQAVTISSDGETELTIDRKTRFKYHNR
ncbi:hypothetical protein GCM10020331_102280 [Ectobacillus funiculus]